MSKKDLLYLKMAKNLVKCEICNKNFKSLGGHLVSKHNINAVEYKKKYPYATINSKKVTETRFKKDLKRKIIKYCIICNKKFTVSKSKDHKLHCSFKCSRVTVSKKIKGITRAIYVELTCSQCDKKIIKQIDRSKQNNIFCNRKCYLNFHKAVKVTKKCKNKNCKNKITINVKQPHIYCSRKCYIIDYDRDKNFDKHHVKGYYISIRTKKLIWYDSSYELTRMKQLDIDENVISWSRCKDRIMYLSTDNKEHYYKPDLIINYKNGKVVVEEVKGKLKAVDLLKIKAALKWYSKKNIEFKIVNYNDIYLDGVLEPIMEKYENKYGVFHRISILYSFIKTAQSMADRSTCLRSTVGCIIAPLNLYNFYSIGYNGSPKGHENGCKSLEPGQCGCIHAEINALNKIKELCIKMDDSLLITTLAPCFNCSKEIIKYPIKKVIYLNAYRDVTGINFLRKNGVEVIKYQELLNISNKELFQQK